MSTYTPGKDEATVKAQTEKVLNDKRMNLIQAVMVVGFPTLTLLGTADISKKNQLEELLPEFDKYPDLLMDGKAQNNRWR